MEILTEAGREQLDALRGEDEFFWLDLDDPGEAELETVGAALRLHPVALQDTREFHQRPKADVYPDHVFLVFYTPSRPGGPEDLGVEVHLYVSGGFILTVRQGNCTRLDSLRDELAGTELDAGEEYLVHRILVALADAYFPLVNVLEERIDGLESAVFHRPRSEQLEQIYRLRQDASRHERRVEAQADYFPGAAEAILALPGLSRGTKPYLDDVADHLTRAGGELRRQREDLASLTNTFFNANANKLNQSATRLSVLATFFVTGTVITGFFGQNFGWLVDSIDSRTDFLVYGLGGLLVPLLALSVYFWRRREDWM
jgi:magnesium transporter